MFGRKNKMKENIDTFLSLSYKIENIDPMIEFINSVCPTRNDLVNFCKNLTTININLVLDNYKKYVNSKQKVYDSIQKLLDSDKLSNDLSLRLMKYTLEEIKKDKARNIKLEYFISVVKEVY